MISNYCTDIIKIVFTSYNSKGVLTTTDSDEIVARIEDINEIVKDVDGKEQKASILFIFEYDNTISKLDKIKIISKYGDAYEDPDYEFEIYKLEKTGMFSGTHYEVYCG